MSDAGPSKRTAVKPEHERPRMERVLLSVALTEDRRGYTLREMAPSRMRTGKDSDTGPARVLKWIVDVEESLGSVGSIAVENFRNANGQVLDPRDLFENTSKLDARIPTAGKVARLEGKWKAGIPKGVYTYSVVIRVPDAGGDREVRSEEDGEIYACPVWPCGRFD